MYIRYINKKYIILLSTILILILISSFSYASFIYSDIQEGTHIGTSDCFKLSFLDSNNISLKEAIPLTELEAQSLTPYTFTIENICNEAASYLITLEDLNTSDIDLSAIRYKLNDNNSAILGSVATNSNKVLSNTKTSRTIDSAMLLKNEVRTYNLRLWIDENSTTEQAAGKKLETKIVVVATMDKIPYHIITLYKNNGDAISTKNIVKGRDISSIVEPSKTGYSFVSWCIDSNLTNEITSSYIPLEDLDIYAKYSANSHTVTLDDEAATTSGSLEVSATYDSAMPLITVPSKTGYTFSGYYSGANGTGTKYYNSNGSSANNYNIASNTTLYAYWVVNQYTISYSGNSGTPARESDTKDYGTIVKLPSASRTSTNYNNFSFNGWYTAATGGTRVGGAGDDYVVRDSTTLYAQWSSSTRYFTLSFGGVNNDWWHYVYINGTLVNSNLLGGYSVQVTYNSTVKILANWNNAGLYAFNSGGTVANGAGWKTSSTSSGAKGFYFYMPASDVSLSLGVNDDPTTPTHYTVYVGSGSISVYPTTS